MTTPKLRPEATATVGPVIVVPEHEVEHEAEVVYSEDFEAGDDGGWSTFFGFSTDAVALSGEYSFQLTNTDSGDPTDGKAVYTVTGLTPGGDYTLRAWVKGGGAAYGASLGVTGKSNVSITPGDTIWHELTYNFTATATSHELYFTTGGTSGGPATFWDDITLTQDAWTEVVPDEIGTVDLPISEGKVTLADDWSPYIQAVFDVPIENEDLLEQIDPRLSQRVTIEASETVGGTSFTADLGLRARRIDQKSGVLTMELASDEALLMDRCNVSTSVDKGARQYEDSLRDVVDWALDKIGATLEAGTDDADVTARWSAQNSILNPDGISTGAAYTNAGSTTVTYNTTAGAGVGGTTGYVVGTSTAFSGSYNFIGIPQKVSTRKGDMWTLSLYARRTAGQPALNGVLRIYEWDTLNGTILKQHESTPKVITESWARFDFTFTVENPNTTTLSMYFGYAAGATGRSVGIDHVMLTEGPLLLDYFSGAVAPAGYTTAWTGQTSTANNSVSERVPADGIERLPEVFDWSPGQNLWDFLTPLIEASSLRLFCDEERKWYLVDPETYEKPGYVVVQAGHNAVEGEDEITRNDDTWADAVVCKFTWTNPDGTTSTAYDVAGSTDPDAKCLLYEFEEPFIPGRAARRLAVLQGRGRVQEVTALGTLTARPGQDVMISLPGAYTQQGKLREVIFDLKTGLADYGTRGLTDVLPGSWASWDPEETWSEVDPDLTWSDA